MFFLGGVLLVKTEIIKHHLDFMEFARFLLTLDKRLLRKPISEGKWSTVEIIGHLAAWDEFVLRDRIPYFFRRNTFPAGPDVVIFNEQAALKAREIEVIFVIDAFLNGRIQLVEWLREIPQELWFAEIKINQSTLTLSSYFKGLMEHDLHHMGQIKRIIKC